MITITALKWVPPFAQGQVRDHRARWILNEVGWDYRVRLLDAEMQADAGYRCQQPFGQVPAMKEDGRPTLFESGAIILDVATRAGRFIPRDPDQRSQVMMWLFAALNTVEPALARLAEVEFFTSDKTDQDKRRPEALDQARKRLAELEAALGDRQWLVGSEFTIADMMMSSVLKIAASLDVLSEFAALVFYQDRCFDRPAYRKAIDDQCAIFREHGPEDMKWPKQ